MRRARSRFILGSGIGIFGGSNQGKGVLVAFVSADLVEKGLSAGDLIAPAARALGGGASKDPSMSQAGGPRGDQIGEALEEARAAARSALLDT